MSFHRTSKACELCRERKIRCFPGPVEGSCGPCSSVAAKCQYREKPRNRRKQVRTPDRNQRRVSRDSDNDPVASSSVIIDPGPSLPNRTPADTSGYSGSPLANVHVTPSTAGEAQLTTSPFEVFAAAHPTLDSSPHVVASPLKHVDQLLQEWSDQHNISSSALLFELAPRLSTLKGAPLLPAPDQRQFEDRLIKRLSTSPDFGHLNIVDHWSLSSLYERYAALPDTVNEDQRAFIMASLCVIRYSEIRLGQNSPSIRHDITFFNAATAYLRNWPRPSRMSFAALFCLVPYTFSMGGPSESRSLLEQMAWHARGLGLDRASTAKLYGPLGMIGPFFAVCVYSDSFRASLTDVTPCVNLAEVDVDVTPPSTLIANCLIVASRHTSAFLSDRMDSTVNTTGSAYMERRESEWSAELTSLRAAQNDKAGREQDHIAWVDNRTQIAWAELRYCWLRMLLHIPLFHLTLSIAAVTRSLGQTIYTYTDLAKTGNLEPSWPQAQRLLVCGQLLILCQHRGELQRSESISLWIMLLDLLEKHKETWPICGQISDGFRQAINTFGILETVNMSIAADSRQRATFVDANSANVGIDMSIGTPGPTLNMEQYGGIARPDQVDALPFDEFSSEFFSTLFAAMNEGLEGSGPLADFQ